MPSTCPQCRQPSLQQLPCLHAFCSACGCSSLRSDCPVCLEVGAGRSGDQQTPQTSQLLQEQRRQLEREFRQLAEALNWHRQGLLAELERLRATCGERDDAESREAVERLRRQQRECVERLRHCLLERRQPIREEERRQPIREEERRQPIREEERRQPMDASYRLQQVYSNYSRVDSLSPVQPRLGQSPRVATLGCPVSVCCTGEPDRHLYVVEERENAWNALVVYSECGRRIRSLQTSLNPYRIAWCHGRRQLLALNYVSRRCAQLMLLDTRGQPVTPFCSALAERNLAEEEPLDLAVGADTIFLCCSCDAALLLIDFEGRSWRCRPKQMGTPAALCWCEKNRQLAVLHTQQQPNFELATFELVNGQERQLRPLLTCSRIFVSVCPPLAAYLGDRLLVVMVTESYACQLAELAPDLRAVRSKVVWDTEARHPSDCCLMLKGETATLCLCDSNSHEIVLYKL